MDLVGNIKDRIISGSEKFFDDPESVMELQVTIRIADEFRQFFVDFGETPPIDEVAWLMDTIRSGMDETFLLAHSCCVISDEFTRWSFDRQMVSSFSELRAACLRRFEELSRPEASAGELLASLFGVVHLELMFLAQNFPCVVLSPLKNRTS